jgi:hypothetical protein
MGDNTDSDQPGETWPRDTSQPLEQRKAVYDLWLEGQLINTVDTVDELLMYMLLECPQCHEPFVPDTDNWRLCQDCYQAPPLGGPTQ